MLSMGQKMIAFGALLFISVVSFIFSPVLAFIAIPFSIVLGISIWKL